MKLPKTAACILAFNQNRELLTVTRRGTTILSLPGGKVDPGESDVQAAIRETIEETGICFNEDQLFPVFSEIIPGSDGKDFLCTTYVYTCVYTDLLESQTWSVEAGIECRFATIDELLVNGTFTRYNERAIESVLCIPFFKDFLKDYVYWRDRTRELLSIPINESLPTTSGSFKRS